MNMANNIRFDYYQITIDRKRQRETQQGNQFFGRIPLSDIVQLIMNYANTHHLGEHGLHLLNYAHGKKWIKWVNAELEGNKLKLLFTFNDKQVDPRFLTNSDDNILAQPIPNEEYGQRNLLHIVINPDDNNICVQNIVGFTKEYLQRLFVKLINLVTDDDFWIVNDLVNPTETIHCKPYVEISNLTTDTVLHTIQNGGLRGLVITQNDYELSRFDRDNHLTQQKTQITIRAEGDSFINIARDRLIGWVRGVTTEKTNLNNPTIALLVKDPQTGSEVQHEILNDIVESFSKKVFLNWSDRTEETTQNVASKIPKPIAQFYATMINGF